MVMIGSSHVDFGGSPCFDGCYQLAQRKGMLGYEPSMPVTLQDLQDAFELVSAGGMGEHKPSCAGDRARSIGGRISSMTRRSCRTISTARRITSIPDKRELELGKPLVLDFVSQFLADDFDEVR